ncbi:hypothetical protein QBC34DRAFT_394346 [Podospora aff. communis PSN243]|uniref:Uncharacterized protein n=1 Tax=Podospora aff. communis PSN243 TaxID=3040156 RepID=A0AAV9H038_9PEZI|nr:hypothetical protein QBC34DRAFT_394346 [Podospora aff. communis PSN243]
MHTVEWCSWLSRQSNTLKVSGSNPGLIIAMDPHRPAVLFWLFFLLGFDWEAAWGNPLMWDVTAGWGVGLQ